MSSQSANFPSPRGALVDDHGNYYNPLRRNRYSRSSQQTPRIRDVTWLSTPDPSVPPTPRTPSVQSQRISSSPAHGLSSPFARPSTAVPPSPALTERLIGEHMDVEDIVFGQDPYADPYQPKHQGGGIRVMKSLLKGLQKLSRIGPRRLPRAGSVSYGSALAQTTTSTSIPVTMMTSQSASSHYGNPTPPETEEGVGRHSSSPYNSPYVRPQTPVKITAVIPGSFRMTSPTTSAESVPPVTARLPHVRPPDLGANSAAIPTSLRTSAVPSPGSIHHITVVSPSPVIPTVSRPGSISAPAIHHLRDQLVSREEAAAEEGSQTLHDHMYPTPSVIPPSLVIGPPSTHLPPNVPTLQSAMLSSAVDSRGKYSLSSTLAGVRRFVAELDQLPWVSHEQVADVYIPEENPRSRLRAQIRRGTEPSWYNERPEVTYQPETWAEWDLWAKESTAELMWESARMGGWDGMVYAGGSEEGDVDEFRKEGGPFGTVRYPQGGYLPTQPVFVDSSAFPPPGHVDRLVRI